MPIACQTHVKCLTWLVSLDSPNNQRGLCYCCAYSTIEGPCNCRDRKPNLNWLWPKTAIKNTEINLQAQLDPGIQRTFSRTSLSSSPGFVSASF